MTLTDAELRALVLLCLRELERHGCRADPAVTAALSKLTAERQGRDSRPSVTCPRCGLTSYHACDIEEGYCGRCHDWTRGAMPQ